MSDTSAAARFTAARDAYLAELADDQFRRLTGHLERYGLADDAELAAFTVEFDDEPGTATIVDVELADGTSVREGARDTLLDVLNSIRYEDVAFGEWARLAATVDQRRLTAAAPAGHDERAMLANLPQVVLVATEWARRYHAATRVPPVRVELEVVGDEVEFGAVHDAHGRYLPPETTSEVSLSGLATASLVEAVRAVSHTYSVTLDVLVADQDDRDEFVTCAECRQDLFVHEGRWHHLDKAEHLDNGRDGHEATLCGEPYEPILDLLGRDATARPADPDAAPPGERPAAPWATFLMATFAKPIRADHPDVDQVTVTELSPGVFEVGQLITGGNARFAGPEDRHRERLTRLARQLNRWSHKVFDRPLLTDGETITLLGEQPPVFDSDAEGNVDTVIDTAHGQVLTALRQRGYHLVELDDDWSIMQSPRGPGYGILVSRWLHEAGIYVPGEDQPVDTLAFSVLERGASWVERVERRAELIWERYENLPAADLTPAEAIASARARVLADLDRRGWLRGGPGHLVSLKGQMVDADGGAWFTPEAGSGDYLRVASDLSGIEVWAWGGHDPDDDLPLDPQVALVDPTVWVDRAVDHALTVWDRDDGDDEGPGEVEPGFYWVPTSGEPVGPYPTVAALAVDLGITEFPPSTAGQVVDATDGALEGGALSSLNPDDLPLDAVVLAELVRIERRDWWRYRGQVLAYVSADQRVVASIEANGQGGYVGTLTIDGEPLDPQVTESPDATALALRAAVEARYELDEHEGPELPVLTDRILVRRPASGVQLPCGCGADSWLRSGHSDGCQVRGIGPKGARRRAIAAVREVAGVSKVKASTVVDQEHFGLLDESVREEARRRWLKHATS